MEDLGRLRGREAADVRGSAHAVEAEGAGWLGGVGGESGGDLGVVGGEGGENLKE